MSTFALNKEIFNHALYKDVQDVWFQEHTPEKQNIDFAVMKRWFAGSPDERKQFDGLCRDRFARALDAIGPDVFPNPTAEPFLNEIRGVMQRNPEDDGKEAAWTALSLALLLDQMPRNIFRTNDGLVKVYTHYDKMAFSLVSSLLSPTDTPIAGIRPDLHPQWRLSAAHRLWFYMPLVHSESIDSHNKYDDIIAAFEKEIEKGDGLEGTKSFLGEAKKSEREHREILELFGRYPHRNSALGRVSTEEEITFLKEGGMTFGVAQEE